MEQEALTPARRRIERVHEHSYVTSPLTPGADVIDGGGFKGEFAHHIAKSFGCRVHVFEPVPRLAERIESAPGVRLERAALAASAGTATLFAADETTTASMKEMSSTLVPELAYGFHEPIEVDTVVLPDYLDAEGIEEVALLKLDIEGAEEEVLASLPGEVLDRIAQITVEFHAIVHPERQPGIDRATRRLEDAGFLRIDFSTVEMDVLFVNPRLVPLSTLERAWILARYKYASGIRRRLTRLLTTGRLT